MLVFQLLAAKFEIFNHNLLDLLRFAEGVVTGYRYRDTLIVGWSALRVDVVAERLESAPGYTWLVERADFAWRDAGQLVPITASYFDLHMAGRRCSFRRSWSDAIDQQPVGEAVPRVVLLEWNASSCVLLSFVFGESVYLSGRGVLPWGRWWESMTFIGQVSTVFDCYAALESLAVRVDFIGRIDGVCSCCRREDYDRISALLLVA